MYSSDEEDDTAELMAELAKIKQERAEEKARQVSHHCISTVLFRSLSPFNLGPDTVFSLRGDGGIIQGRF